MTVICKNCGHPFEGNYCNNCGQAADVHQMNLHFLWHDIQHGLFHFDNGIFYTIQQLFIRPGYAVREFIEGKRIKHFKPFSFLIVTATLYGFLYHHFLSDVIANFTITPAEVAAVADIPKVIEWMSTHFAIVSLLSLPVVSLCSFLAFKKTGDNYVVNLVLNAYLSGQIIVVRLLLFPLHVISNHTPYFSTFVKIQGIITTLLTFFTYMQFFNQLKTSERFWRTVLSYFYIGVFLLFATVTGIIILKMQMGK